MTRIILTALALLVSTATLRAAPRSAERAEDTPQSAIAAFANACFSFDSPLALMRHLDECRQG
jgi:hypothetical protein